MYQMFLEETRIHFLYRYTQEKNRLRLLLTNIEISDKMPIPNKRKQQRKKHRVPLARILIGAIGIILLWRGVWDFVRDVPIIEDPIVSIVIGLLLLYISHEYYREL